MTMTDEERALLDAHYIAGFAFAEVMKVVRDRSGVGADELRAAAIILGDNLREAADAYEEATAN